MALLIDYRIHFFFCQHSLFAKDGTRSPLPFTCRPGCVARKRRLHCCWQFGIGFFDNSHNACYVRGVSSSRVSDCPLALVWEGVVSVSWLAMRFFISSFALV